MPDAETLSRANPSLSITMKQELITTQEETPLPLTSPLLNEETDKSENALPLEAESTLVASVSQQVKRYNRSVFTGVLSFGLFTMLITIGLKMLFSQVELQDAIAILAIFSSVLLFLFGFYVIVRPRQKLHEEKKQLNELIRQKNLQNIGTLVEVMRLEKEMNTTDAQQSLTELLPQLRPEHASLLNRRQRGLLRNVLNTNIEHILNRDVSHLFTPVSLQNPANRRAIEFRVAIMKAIAQVGTKEDLPIIEKYATMEAVSETQQVVKNAAQECLPLLQIRIAEQEDKNTLLRASSAEAHSPETLLRPASPTQDPAELLLRPHGKE